MPENLTLIFVSKNPAEVTMEDLGFRLPESRYSGDTQCNRYGLFCVL